MSWQPVPEVAAANGFAQAGDARLQALEARLGQSRTQLYRIPDTLTIPSADDEASRANAAETAAKNRLQASAASIAKLRNMGREVEVPDVVRLKAADAKGRLTSAGFTNITLAASARTPAAGDEPHTIEQQSPAAGTRARLSAAITLTVLGAPADTSSAMASTPGKLKIPAGLPGLTEEDATARLKAAGFTAVAIVAANSPTPEGKGGTVEQHVPQAGTEHDAATVVTLYIFPRPGEAIVPGVGGLKVAEAKLQIEGAGLKTGFAASNDPAPDAASEFTVQAQSPAKGARLKRGEVVTLTIYPKFGPPPPGTVPLLTGLTLETAVAHLAALGLKPGEVKLMTLPAGVKGTPGTIAQQVPKAGSALPADKTVNIVVWAAPAPVGPAVAAADSAAAHVAMGNPGQWEGTYKGTITLTRDTSNPPKQTGVPQEATFTLTPTEGGTWRLVVQSDRQKQTVSYLNGQWTGLKPKGHTLGNSYSAPNYESAESVELAGHDILGTIQKTNKNPSTGQATFTVTYTFRATRTLK